MTSISFGTFFPQLGKLEHPPFQVVFQLLKMWIFSFSIASLDYKRSIFGMFVCVQKWHLYKHLVFAPSMLTPAGGCFSLGSISDSKLAPVTVRPLIAEGLVVGKVSIEKR